MRREAPGVILRGAAAMPMPDVVLALGFDLFFKPKLNTAAAQEGVEIRYAQPADALKAAQDATRIVADVSAPGVQDAVVALRRARPDIPLLACYPHVEEHRATAIRQVGGVAITRGRFASSLGDALSGRLGA